MLLKALVFKTQLHWISQLDFSYHVERSRDAFYSTALAFTTRLLLSDRHLYCSITKYSRDAL